MKCNRSTAFVALAMLALLGFIGPLAAKDKGKDKDKDQVPFRGCLEGDVTITPDTPPFIIVAIDAEGHASHLGRFTLSIPHRVNRDTRIASGSYHFVAADGDTLTADFTGQSAPTATPAVLAIVGNATITGGTGRFAGATGGFTCERLFDTVSGETSGCFEGTISTPGKEKDKCGR